MASFTLAPVLYGKVVGRFVALVGDGVDADVYPDAAPLSGTVTFTASAPKLLVPAASPDPVTAETTPIVATLDANGYLTFNGQQGVWLTATNDTTLNPPGFTYQVKYALTYNGNTIDKSQFDIAVPASSLTDPTTWTDLTKVAPVPSSPGNAIVQGPPGPSNTLTIGVVQSGPVAAATITGSSPNQQLNLTMPTVVGGGGGTGTVKSVNNNMPDTGGNVTVTPQSMTGFLDTNGDIQLSYFPNLLSALPSSMVMFVRESGGTYGPRPTSRTDTMVLWFGPDTPAIVTSGTAGMLDGIDSWFQTVS